MKIIFKSIYYASLVLFSLVLILLVLSFFPIGDGFRMMVVQSGSMEPEFGAGSMILVYPSQEYEEGDIITFRRDEERAPITHRIQEVVKDDEITYITKGDANVSHDMDEVAIGQVIGKVRLSIPYIGTLIDFARTPYGFVLLIAVPALIVIVDEGRNIWRSIKTEKKKTGPFTESIEK